MKRLLTTVAIFVLCATQLRADVKVTSTTTVEGPVAAMMGGMMPSVVTQIKGMKARTDITMGTMMMSTIVDIEAKQIVLLNEAEKTAQVFTTDSPPSVPKGFVMPKIDASLKPTGRSKVISGAQCEEHTMTMSMNMAEMNASAQMPESAAQMMKDLRMSVNGSLWVAKSGPGVAEYVAFQTASAKTSMATIMRAMPGMATGGFDRLMEQFAAAAGLPYLTEMTMNLEGGGEMAAAMKQFGNMKMINRVTDVSTTPLADDIFRVPEGYKVIK